MTKKYGFLFLKGMAMGAGFGVAARTFEQENIMVVANRNKEGKTIDLARFSQGLKGATSGENLITEEKVDLSRGAIEVGPMETLILWVK